MTNENQNREENIKSEQEPQFSQKMPLGRGQKIAAGVLAVFAFFIMIVWSVQFKNNISGAMNRNVVKKENKVSSENENSQAVLTAKDTDGDGLNDWDELNVYKTSPYLEDSDSDGFWDGEEINNGKDPNCPTGRVCSSSVGGEDELSAPKSEGGATGSSEDLSNIINSLNGGAENVPAGSSDQNMEKLLQGGSDVKELRALLLQYGMNKEILDKISDEELLKSYKNTLAE